MTDGERVELEAWISNYCRKTIAELLSSVAMKAKEKPIDLSQDLHIHLISTLIGVTLYSHLRDSSIAVKKMSKESEKQKAMIQSYTLLKGRIQEAVASAFMGAMTTFSGKSADYYCLIKPVPDAANKEPC